jgi:phosphatidylglycerophosphate synthase
MPGVCTCHYDPRVAVPELHVEGSARAETLFERSRKSQPATEFVCEYLFRPLAHLVVLALLPLRIAPPLVVAAGTATGFAAAVELARGHLIAAALLLQLKTVLDNADGQLARASDRVTVLGRYLDSEADLIVGAALWASIGFRTGSPFLAVLGFVLLTAIVSANFNVKHLYRQAHGERAETMPPPTDRATAALAKVYALVYAPQDRVAARFAAWRIRRLGTTPERYHDAGTIAVVANLGLSTQLFVLGIFVASGHPLAFCFVLLAQVIALVALELRRGRLCRSTRRNSWS